MNKGQIIAKRKCLVVVVIVVMAALIVEGGIGPHAYAQMITGVIDLGATGGGIAVNTGTNRAYVSVGSQIHVYDAQTYALVATIALPGNYGACYDVAVNPVTNRVYAIAFRTYVIDGNTNTVLANFQTRGDEAVVNSVTNRVYIADRLTDPAVVHVLAGATNTWLPDITVGDPGAIGYVYLAANPTTNRVYIAFTGDDDLRVLDGNTHAEVTRVHVDDVGSVAVNPDTHRVYVGTGSEDVIVLEGTTHTQVGAIARLGTQLRLNRLTNRLYGLDPASPGYVVRVADLATDSVVGYVYLDGNLVDYDVHLSLGQLFGTHATSPSTWRKKMSILQDASPTSPAPTPPLPRVTATLTLPEDGDGVAVNTLTNRLYVGVDGGISVFDATTLDSLSYISLPGDLGSPDVAVDETRNQIYAVTGSKTHVISGTNEQVIGNLGSGNDIFVNSTNGRVYIADTGFYIGEPDVVKIYDGVTLTHVRTLNLGTSSYYESIDMAVNPTTGYAYCTYSFGDVLHVISPATDEVAQTLDFTSIGDVAVNPATNRVYVWVSRSDQSGVLILDGSTHAELGMTSGASGHLETNPQTNRLYGATGSTLFRAYDGDFNRTLGRVFLDASIADYAVYPALSRLYVTHHSHEVEQSKKLSVIQDTSWTPEWTFLPLTIKNK
ncbi:MAG: YncE family protein [Anaerolineae bacterium]|nr:YncE family protein [Anaerolineae bacterium]